MRHFEHQKAPDEKMSLGKGIAQGRMAGQERKPPSHTSQHRRSTIQSRRSVCWKKMTEAVSRRHHE